MSRGSALFVPPFAAPSSPSTLRSAHHSFFQRRPRPSYRFAVNPLSCAPTSSPPTAAATTAAPSPNPPPSSSPAQPQSPASDASDTTTPPPPPPGYTPPTISVSAAHSALSSLVSYYRALCREQPFIAYRLAAAITCVLLSKLLGLAVPFLFKRAIDSLSLPTAATAATATTASASAAALKAAVTAIVLHGLARVFASLTHELRNGVFAKAGQRIGRAITATAFAHLHAMDVAFHAASRTGALTRVVDRGTRSVMTIFRALLFSFVPTFFELVLVCGVLFARFSFAYVAVVLATFAVFTAWTLSINNEMGRTRAEMNAAENEASARLTDSLINVEAVKAFANAPLELRQYDTGLATYERLAVRNEWLYGRLNMGQNIAYTLGLTALLALAARDVVAGSLSVGAVVLLATMVQRLWIPLDFLGWQYREVKQSLIDVQNLFDVLAIQPAILDTPDARPLRPSGGEIVFENVSFEYPDASDVGLPFLRRNAGGSDDEEQDESMELRELDEGDSDDESTWTKSANASANGAGKGAPEEKNTRRKRAALDGVSFTVPAGKSVALVGSSGSGKSTATRLLYRLYDLTGGRILIDGQDIRKATLSSLRQAVSIVPQDTSLFNDTIAYNIRYGRPDATDEEVIAAAKAASIHEVIERTSNGYDTMVGERGVRLSGGERQRLSVARAFLKGSCVIIEDESTSALDTLTELEVSRALDKLGANRSRLIVAHRLSTIMHVDWIVVLQHGRKVEEGTFDDLLGRPNGIFRGMWERQQRKNDSGSGNNNNGVDRVDAGESGVNSHNSSNNNVNKWDSADGMVDDDEVGSQVSAYDDYNAYDGDDMESGGKKSDGLCEEEQEERLRELRASAGKAEAESGKSDSGSGSRTDDADGRIDGGIALDGGGRWRA